MKNVLTIFRRDISAYFTSPIGYIFMIVFVLMSVGLFITSFFLFPVADMRPFFSNLPLLLCVFIPAVTMRIWAEERKENTWEMLLTFPMRSWELATGKFLAGFVFFALTMASTITVPLMLVSLGNPDNGALLCGYLGTLMLGAFFLSIGIFFSGFFKDQIVAFVVTLLMCFTIFLLGNGFIAGYIDSIWPDHAIGTLLSQLVGMNAHYESFSRGVVALGDVMYFAAWTVLFLALNIMYIEGRSRPKAQVTFAGAVIICAAIGLLFNFLLGSFNTIRWDATEDKVYTVSDASKSILSKVDVPVTVSVYITEKAKMPTQLKDLEQSIVDKLEELKLAAGGKLQYKTVHMAVENVLADKDETEADKKDKTEDEVIEKRMLDKGVEPFSVQAFGQNEVTNKLIYSSIGVGYREKKEEIITPIMPQNLQELEYRIVSTVHKLTREKAPVVALIASKDSIDPQMRMMLQQMGREVPPQDDPYQTIERVLGAEKYDVQRVDLTEDSPMPEEYDAVAVINPRNLNDRQRWEINRALVAGKPVVMAVQNYEWEYRPTAQGINTSKREEKPEVNALLSHYGLGVAEEILLDTNYVPLTVSSGNPLEQLLGGGQTVNLPVHVIVNNNTMDTSTSITNRLSSIFYLWGSPLTVDEDTLKKHGLECKTLIRSTDQAWTLPGSTQKLTSDRMVPPASGRKGYPLMVMVSGQFPDAFKDQPRPAWPEAPQMPNQPPKPPHPEEAEAKPVTPAPGKLILLGCSEPFRKNFLQPGSGNLDLFMNSIDAVTLGDELVNVRSRKPIERAISKPTATTANTWKIINYSLATVVIAAIGIASSVYRRRSRNAYTMAYGSED